MKKIYSLAGLLLLPCMFLLTCAATPKLIYPKDRSVFNTCTDSKTFIVNANDKRARLIYVSVFQNDPRQLLYTFTKLIPTPEQATQDMEVSTYPYKYFLENGQYLIEVKTLGQNGVFIGQRYFTIFATGSTGGSKPLFDYPAQGATDVGLTPTIRLKPYTSCGTLGRVIYLLDRHPADWKGNDLQIDTLDGAVYEWKVPKMLDTNTDYDVSVMFQTDYFSPYDQVSHLSFRTAEGSQLAGDPILVSPAPGSDSIPICGRYTGVTVNPNHSDARSLVVNIFLNDPRTLIGSAGGKLTAQEAVSNISLAFFNTLHPLTQYLIEVKTYDTTNHLLKQKYFTIFTPARDNPTPEFIYPLADQTQVSLSPVIRVKPFPDKACGTLENILYVLRGGGEAISEQVGAGVYAWAVPHPLQPNTSYQLTVYFRGRGITPIGADVSNTISFMTGSSGVSSVNTGSLEANQTSSSARISQLNAAESVSLEMEPSRIFPNPASDQTTLYLSARYQQAYIKVIGLDGRILEEKQLRGGQSLLVGDKLRSGLYLILIMHKNRAEEQFKFVKQE
ncbi:T9SS type A sorting domain-containing protein [Xanthocytophaga agilis]|uniref:T9SS type A sorting domain-containing protein n=1 Tax=Xanthocytophaga agilis TaxID=3048010 RepID=A0AAE3R2U8_9BACT|nr:T9SS type A sorting domain-containing protein [Xanthocytophaga agilis]MDJ1500319.1 T9SS type A sorting domain-containing protein [Xanthocytophaga agilis]